MTDLPTALGDAYAARMQLNGNGAPTWADAVAALVNSGVPLADMTTIRDNLRTVEDRCIVSKVQRQALDEAIARMPAA